MLTDKYQKIKGKEGLTDNPRLDLFTRPWII
jgi:hypothetical protein